MPATEQIREVGRWLEPNIAGGLYATANLTSEEPAFAPLTGVASGLVATRISGEASDMLIWFRNERVRTVTWGGNPFQKVSSSDDPLELSPRRSYIRRLQHQLVEKSNLSSRSIGDEPQRRLRILPPASAQKSIGFI